MSRKHRAHKLSRISEIREGLGVQKFVHAKFSTIKVFVCFYVRLSLPFLCVCSRLCMCGSEVRSVVMEWVGVGFRILG